VSDTILAADHVTTVFPRLGGTYGVNVVVADARVSFYLVPADRPPKHDPPPGPSASSTAWTRPG
jgi:hypothetical protein